MAAQEGDQLLFPEFFFELLIHLFLVCILRNFVYFLHFIFQTNKIFKNALLFLNLILAHGRGSAVFEKGVDEFRIFLGERQAVLVRLAPLDHIAHRIAHDHLQAFCKLQ